ncbi:MAG: hypothetical protein EA357_05265, partial [Micavibrio sp.]
IKIKIGDKDFDVTSVLKGSKSMRQGGLYHFDTRMTLRSGTTRYFILAVDKKAMITDCKPTNASFVRNTKAYQSFIKAHDIRISAPETARPPKPKEQKWKDFSSALAGLAAQSNQNDTNSDAKSEPQAALP